MTIIPSSSFPARLSPHEQPVASLSRTSSNASTAIEETQTGKALTGLTNVADVLFSLPPPKPANPLQRQYGHGYFERFETAVTQEGKRSIAIPRILATPHDPEDVGPGGQSDRNSWLHDSWSPTAPEARSGHAPANTFEAVGNPARLACNEHPEIEPSSVDTGSGRKSAAPDTKSLRSFDSKDSECWGVYENDIDIPDLGLCVDGNFVDTLSLRSLDSLDSTTWSVRDYYVRVPATGKYIDPGSIALDAIVLDYAQSDSSDGISHASPHQGKE
jgi:hypothetical protein